MDYLTKQVVARKEKEIELEFNSFFLRGDLQT